LLRRTIATIFVCYGVLYAIPAVVVLASADNLREQIAMWMVAAIMVTPGVAFVVVGTGVLAGARWWRRLAVGASLASSVLWLLGFPVPAVFLMVNLAVIAGALRFWLRRRLLRLWAG
jgi:hypothetical protein